MAAESRSHRPWVLGIDLGANSVGWAALAIGQSGEPVGLLHAPSEMAERPAMGVRIFEIGVEHYGQGEREETRGVKRRQARLQRRQVMRRARRMRKTFYVLQRAGLLPQFEPGAIASAGSPEIARDHLLKSLDQQLASSLTSSLEPGRARTVHELLPYWLRTSALDQKLEPFALGRALYHLAQRRGFASNRKSSRKGDDEGAVKKGISELRAAMQAQGSRTLGEHLLARAREGDRARARWTARNMYLEEFESIWKAQEPHHGAALSEGLKRRLHRSIFHQRPLKSQSNLVGTCELENGGEWMNLATGAIQRVKRRRRAPECLLVSQRFRLHQKVNDLAIVDDLRRTTPLDPEQRQRVVDLLEASAAVSFTEIRKALGLKKVKFNLEAGGERKLPGNRTNAELLRLFGDRWSRLDALTQDAIVLELWSAPDEPTLVRRAKSKAGPWAVISPTADECEQVARVGLSSEYMSLSRRAMDRLLPLMREGKSFVSARRELYGEPVSQDADELLPPVVDVFDDLRNPVVSRALNELRRVVNHLIKYYGRPAQIRVELARDLKRGKKERNRLEKQNRDNEKEREKAAQRIAAEAGIHDPRPADILKLRLADECNWICPYTGRSIAMAQLFGADIDVEHIIPLSRCLDDSFLNKTLCFADFNRTVKRNQTPHEALGRDSERWREAVSRLERNVRENRMAPVKLERFQLAGDALGVFLEDFKNSQLNDTRHASLRAKEYLARLYGGNLAQGVDADGRRRVTVSTGQATALVRRTLGLERASPGGAGSKRDDHRHHAIDALATALTDARMIQALNRNAEENWETRRGRIGGVPPPWPDFDRDLRACVERIVVSHAVKNRVRGALHTESIYSPRRATDGARNAHGPCTHIRKPLHALSVSEVGDIVDPVVAAIVRAHLAGRAPNEVIKVGDATSFPTLPNCNGPRVPIRRVRIRKSDATHPVAARAPYRAREVQSDTNHHLVVQRGTDARGRETVGFALVPLHVAMQRKSAGEPIVQRSPEVVCTIVKNDTVVLRAEDGSERLCHVGSISEKEFEGSWHTDARSFEVRKRAGGRVRVSPKKFVELACRKITVSPIGVVRPCRA